MSTSKNPRKSALPLVDTLELAGKRVFLRVDLDAPVENGKIVDDTRIRAALPTIKHCLERGARLILAGHMGRPKGVEPACSLVPAGDAIAGHLKTEILLADDPVGDGPTKLARELRDGQILMLENLRFNEGEEKNDDAFARQLAAFAEIFVNDAFGACHRPYASTTGITGQLKTRAAGFQLADELDALGRLLAAPKADFVAVLGGTRFADEISLFERMVGRAETIVAGGVLGHTFLAAQGKRLGATPIETGHLRTAVELLSAAQKRGVEVLLPVDHLAAERAEAGAASIHVPETDVPAGLIALDIGPRTQSAFRGRIEAARTVFWHGAIGAAAWSRFATGTHTVARAAAANDRFAFVVGDDALRAVSETGVGARISHLSTGGAASLEFIEGRDLPGLTALGWKRGN